MMYKKIPSEDFDSLYQLLFKYYPVVEKIRGIGNTFIFSNQDMELYIRILPENQLTIARIDVGEGYMRKGIGTAILQWLKIYCREHNIPRIKMESVLTPECKSFCQKHGFTNESHSPMDYILEMERGH